MTDERKCIALDVGAIAKRARQIALENAKSAPGIAVGPEAAFVATALDYLCIREALREIEPNPIKEIFDKVKSDLDAKPR